MSRSSTKRASFKKKIVDVFFVTTRYRKAFKIYTKLIIKHDVVTYDDPDTSAEA